MKHLILPLFALAWAVSVRAGSDRVLSGSVADANGETIPGANIVWLGSKTGTSTDLQGAFSLKRTGAADRLVVSCIGFATDTLTIAPEQEYIDIVLREGMELAEVNVTARKITLGKLRGSVMNTDMVSREELFRAACCNLGESFVTNPSVDVNYSDAATGAKQIRLLGLSGTYVQLLTENIPNFRGASAPYALGYVPGPWMQSIQVSKGTSSVKNGYEALTGQINIEFKKPQAADADWVSANLFGSTTGRYEANADASVKLTDKWSTMLLAHYENETRSHDANDDGFADLPMVEQYNLFNRWAYMGDRYIFQAGIKALREDRTSGQVSHGGHSWADPYRVGIRTDRYEAFVKQALVFDKEHNTNLALILSGTLHDMDASYGRKLYDVDQQNAYASLIFETDFTPQHSLSTGVSFNYDHYAQHFRLTNDAALEPSRRLDKEAVTGLYAQYTYKPSDKLTLMAGVRGDYSNLHGSFFTPRANVRYAPNDIVTFRASVGKGYRTNHVLAENNYLLASSRAVRLADDLKQEEAWNYGVSVATSIPVAEKTLTLNAEYYYTDFLNQVVVDMESNAHEVAFTNLDGRSYSHVFQVEASYPFFAGFNLTAAWRWTNVRHEIGGVLYEKALTGRYKGLLTASYKTPLGKWQFDATWQQNGGGRMPKPYTLADGSLSWGERYGSFGQLSMQVTRFFRRWSVYVGGENLTNFKQRNPIIGADNPWGDTFDATMVWGPMHGATGYVGVRFNLPRGN
ncbi:MULTISPECIES: TonB-dependent receptor [Mediterranea]|uniref:TonB-dependent receptor n=1 Tax=Mediterranea TaxID=1926659 RepID=UPI002010DC19|nr:MULTISPECIES: TonB-dependent receptor [Mediterranea]MCL1608158.1 TonB-dependent receptor [Mediterranea sp. ET5]MDM8122017.1 TonB-dependent receptor [Mediterranea massiliensis]MDM8198285.1 TonB-dependent receptor [Mediterranea massiliensis]